MSMRYIIFLLLIACSVGVWAEPASAAAQAAITVRTGTADAINSITLTHSEATKVASDWLPTALFRIDFSVTATEADVRVPIKASRGATTQTGDLEYVIESREGVVHSGYSAGVVLSDATIENGDYVIKMGQKGTFSLYVAYADTAIPDREDRLRVTGMTLGTGIKDAELNASEVAELKSERIELFD